MTPRPRATAAQELGQTVTGVVDAENGSIAIRSINDDLMLSCREIDTDGDHFASSVIA
jgi:hypothetical protein